MIVARVIGSLVATRKDPKLEGLKLLLVQPVDADEKNAGETMVATDSIGAGAGEYVCIAGGREASYAHPPPYPPVDSGIFAIADDWYVIGK